MVAVALMAARHRRPVSPNMRVRQRSSAYLSGCGRGLGGGQCRSMTEISVPESVRLRRGAPGAVVLQVLTVALASLVMTVSYGLAFEYGNTASTTGMV